MKNAGANLPLDLTQGLARLGGELRRGKADPSLVAHVVNRCGDLPLRGVEESGWAIRTLAQLRTRPVGIISGLFGYTPGDKPPRHHLLLRDRTPGLEWLDLFHASGWYRQSALESVSGPCPNAFWMAALIHRLNDWVPQVRAAAVGALDRVVPETSPRVLARTVVALLDRRFVWQRWGFEASTFDQLLGRPQVREEIASILLTGASGPLARTLRLVLRGSDFDGNLLLLAQSANQPAIRSIALETLLMARARWRVGWERKWIDKSHGVWRYAPVFATREVARPCGFDDIVRLGLSDKAAAVRKVAASAIIQYPNRVANLAGTASLMARDPSPAIRARAEFILKRLGSSE